MTAPCLYRKVSDEVFIRYDPLDDSYRVVSADEVPALVPATPKRVRMSVAKPADRKRDQFRRAILLTMLEFQRRAHKAGYPGASAPYLKALADLARDPEGPTKLRMSWTASQTKKNTVKAVGSGSDAGRTLYGKEAEAALRAQNASGGSEPQQAVRPSAQKAQEILTAIYTTGATPEHFAALTTHLPALPVPQLRSAIALLGASFSGVREKKAMVDSITNHVRGLVDAENGVKPGTPTVHPIDYQHKNANEPIVKALRANPHAQAALHAVLTIAASNNHEEKVAVLRDQARKLTQEYDTLKAKPDMTSEDTAKLSEMLARRREVSTQFKDARDASDAAVHTGRTAALDQLAKSLKTSRMGSVTTVAIPETIHDSSKAGGDDEVREIDTNTAEGHHVHESARKANQFITSMLSGCHLKVAHGIASSGRAFCAKGTGMSIVANSTEHTADVVSVHELGHAIEHQKPGVKEAAFAFLKYRIGNEQPTSLREKYGVAYDAHEMGRKDDFEKAFGDSASAYYVGKDYGERATEIVSMGLEKLYSDPVGFAKADPEYFQFVAHLLTMPARGTSHA